MTILAKTQKRYEGKSERGGVATTPPPFLLRERVRSAGESVIYLVSGVVRPRTNNGCCVSAPF